MKKNKVTEIENTLAVAERMLALSRDLLELTKANYEVAEKYCDIAAIAKKACKKEAAKSVPSVSSVKSVNIKSE